MKTKPILIAVLFFLSVSPLILWADNHQNDNPPETVKVNNIDNLQTSDPVATTKCEPSPDFEKVPVQTIYGPIGIILKTIEITLDKLYIICECKW